VTIQTVLALLLTFLLGPGAGHIYLRQYKKGILLIIATLFFAVIMAFQAVSTLSPVLKSTPPAQLYQLFSTQHPGIMFYYDLAFAAIWAYAFVDAFFLSRGPREINTHEENQ
jgi:hypothetical protein